MIVIYKDIAANAVFMEDNNGAQFLNSLQATLGSNANLCTIKDLAKGYELVTDLIYTSIFDDNGVNYGANATETVNNLNVVFVTSGTSLTNLPVITSNLSVNSTQGDVINYELTADYGVGYEWDNLPTGLTTVEGNVRKLIGGSSLTPGTYTPTMRAVNYNGEDVETLTIVVASPPFSNTKSTKFVKNDYLTATASELSSVLGRAANGSGASDAWTINMYFKLGTHTGPAKQTLFYHGDSDHNNGGHVWIYHKGNEGAVYLEYGSKDDYIRLRSPLTSLVQGSWHNLCFTYDGGTTGVSSGSVSDYYSRFTMFIDGASVTTTNSNGNSGWGSDIASDVLQVGKRAAGNDWLKNDCKVDEISVWASDQSSNITDIYNLGVPHDLALLPTTPNAWWRMGDGDTYPTLQDSIGSTDFSMVSMTSADIVNDVP